MTYYKAVRPDGHDFYTGTVQWAVKPGEIVRHPTSTLPPDEWSGACDYLSVATVPTNCTGMKWPCRLFEVAEVDGHPVGTPNLVNLPHKRAATAWRVVREVDPRLALGPQGEVLVEFLDALRDLTDVEVEALGVAGRSARGAAWYAAGDTAGFAAWGAARDVAWYAALEAGRGAAGNAAQGAAWGDAWAATWDAAWYAALALVVADLVGQYGLTREHLDTLTGPARTIPRLAKIIDRAPSVR